MKTFTRKDRSEVDTRVEQEIKNYKDLMYEAHQKINAVNEGMVSLSIQHEKSKAQLANDGKVLLIFFENLKESVESLVKDVLRRMGDAEQALFKVLDQFNTLREEVEVHYLTKEDFEEAFNNLDRTVIANRLQQTLKNDNFNQYFEHLKAKAIEDLKNLRKELAPITPEVDQAQLDEKFNLWKVDFDGLVREIAFLKQAVGYDQKKFENVYTLIGRLKEEKKCHQV